MWINDALKEYYIMSESGVDKVFLGQWRERSDAQAAFDQAAAQCFGGWIATRYRQAGDKHR